MREKTIKRGEIYWVNLNPTKGSEIKKIRPCLIISNELQNKISSRVIVLPITSNIKFIVPFHINIKLNNVEALILCEQIRVIDKSRIKDYLDKLNSEILEKVEFALKIVLDFKN